MLPEVMAGVNFMRLKRLEALDPTFCASPNGSGSKHYRVSGIKTNISTYLNIFPVVVGLR